MVVEAEEISKIFGLVAWVKNGCVRVCLCHVSVVRVNKCFWSYVEDFLCGRFACVYSAYPV